MDYPACCSQASVGGDGGRKPFPKTFTDGDGRARRTARTRPIAMLTGSRSGISPAPALRVPFARRLRRTHTPK